MSTHREWLRSGAQMMLLSLIEEQDRYGFEIIQELEKPRKYYSITKKGSKQLVEDKLTWEMFAESVRKVVNSDYVTEYQR